MYALCHCTGFCLVCDNEFQDCDDSERIEEEEQFKVLSLKEKISDARGERRASHFYGQATRLSFDATDGTNKMSAVKARPPKPRYSLICNQQVQRILADFV